VNLGAMGLEKMKQREDGLDGSAQDGMVSINIEASFCPHSP
jgi:hypothetical protein